MTDAAFEKVPGPQLWQATEPEVAWKVPAMQSVQASAPDVDELVPGAHEAQLVAMLVGWAVPGAQFRQVLEPVAGWNEPGVHDVQLGAARAEKVPIAQLVHNDEPDVEKVPGRQS